MGKYRNIFFSEAIALIEPKLHQSLVGPLQSPSGFREEAF
jgi:hypothetical protein